MEMLHLLRLTYTGSEKDAAPFAAAHATFLERHQAAGVFLLSGRTVPSGEGGAIVACGVDRAAIERIVGEDPFVRSGTGAYTITTVDAGRVHPALAGLLAG